VHNHKFELLSNDIETVSKLKRLNGDNIIANVTLQNRDKRTTSKHKNIRQAEKHETNTNPWNFLRGAQCHPYHHHIRHGDRGGSFHFSP